MKTLSNDSQSHEWTICNSRSNAAEPSTFFTRLCAKSTPARLFALHSLLFVLASIRIDAAPLGTAFTYQGRLTDSSGPVNGLYDVNLRLFTDASSPTQVGDVTRTAVAVSNGLFTTLVDFGAGAFTGQACWIEMAVRTNGTGAFATLAPRQELTPAPYALYVPMAGTVSNGSVVATQLKTTNAPAAGQVLGYNGNSLVWQPPLGDSVWSLNGAKAYYNRGNVGIGVATPGESLTVGGDTLADTKIEVNAGGDQYAAVRIRNNQGSWNWQVTPSGDLPGGRMRLADETTGREWLAVTHAGNVGIGTHNPQRRLQVGDDQIPNSEGLIRLASRSGSGPASRIWEVGVPEIDENTELGYHFVIDDTQRNGFNPEFIIRWDSGNVGIGSLNPQGRLEVAGQDALRLVGYEPFMGFFDTNKNYARARIQSAEGNLFLKPDGGHVTAEATDLWLGHGSRRGTPGRALVDGGGALHVNFDSAWGNTIIGGSVTEVRTLRITGGADLAEPFQISGRGIPKGSVVIIDEQNPGHLKISERAYDTRVAGIVSGGNGVNAGITMHQEGLIEGNENIALSGRVYVQADASGAPIAPGDLLTTSELPGHAMKVTDHARAQGAILGKAMSALREGNGLVLVLVTLQ